MSKNFLMAAWLLLSLTVSARAQDGTSDAAAVRRTVENYLQTVDPAARKRSLHPAAKIYSAGSRGVELFETLVSKPARRLPPEATVEQYPQSVVAVDVTKDGASVKVETDLSSVAGPAVSPRKHVQYLSLLKLNGEWKIVSILMPPLRFAGATSGRGK